VIFHLCLNFVHFVYLSVGSCVDGGDGYGGGDGEDMKMTTKRQARQNRQSSELILAS
jgi:hypothetical protein